MASTNTQPSLISQAKDLVNNTVENVKEIIGISVHPQANVVHGQEYLNDIVKGNWKLKHCDTCERTGLDYFGWTNWKSNNNKNYNWKLKYNRYPYLSDIRSKAWKLNRFNDSTGKSDRSAPMFDKNWKFRKANMEGRKQFLSDIRGFKRNGLKHVDTRDRSAPVIKGIKSENLHGKPGILEKIVNTLTGHTDQPSFAEPVIETAKEKLQDAKEFISDKVDTAKQAANEMMAPTPQYDQEWLNDIANTRWTPLKPTKTVDKCGLEFLGYRKSEIGLSPQPLKFNLKYSRQGLFDEIRGRAWKLRHVDSNDRSRPIVSKDFKLRKADMGKRKEFLGEIQNFGTKRKLRPTKIQDLSSPAIRGIKMNKDFKNPSLLTQAKEKIVDTVQSVKEAVMPENTQKEVSGNV